jgi:murein L,D-transpeptidase YafK
MPQSSLDQHLDRRRSHPRKRTALLACAITLVTAVVVSAPCSTVQAAATRSGEDGVQALSRSSGPRVTRVLIKKKDHSLQLLAAPSHAGNGEEVVASYKVAIGPGGFGPKKREGDLVTPVGRYHITMHQPSQYKIFLRLDYPNAEDYKRFASLKKSGELEATAKIGSDIGIHGPPVSVPTPLKSTLKTFDWTAGCIAVDDDEISDIARQVRDGTPVDIED